MEASIRSLNWNRLRWMTGWAASVVMLGGCQDSKFAQLPSLTGSTARAQAPAEPAGPIAVPSGPITPLPSPSTPIPARAVPPSAPTVVNAGGTPQGETQIRVVAMIGSDTVITDDEVWQMVRQRAFEYIKLTGTERDSREKEVFREELRKLIERELILNDFLGKIKKNKPQVLEELKEEANRSALKQLKQFKAANKFPSEEAFVEALKVMGISQKSLLRQLERNSMMSIYINQYMKDKTKVVSLAQVTKYYADHQDEFMVEDQVKWQDLFISYRYFATPAEAKQYADNLAKQAAGGADFVKLVKEHGHGDSKLREGEGIGNKRGAISPPELEATVFKLQPGQVSAPIPTETGLHIVKVQERELAGVRPFDEKVQSFIRMKLGSLVQKAEYEKLVEDLWRKTTVKVIEAP